MGTKLSFQPITPAVIQAFPAHFVPLTPAYCIKASIFWTPLRVYWLTGFFATSASTIILGYKASVHTIKSRAFIINDLPTWLCVNLFFIHTSPSITIAFHWNSRWCVSSKHTCRTSLFVALSITVLQVGGRGQTILSLGEFRCTVIAMSWRFLMCTLSFLLPKLIRIKISSSWYVWNFHRQRGARHILRVVKYWTPETALWLVAYF